MTVIGTLRPAVAFLVFLVATAVWAQPVVLPPMADFFRRPLIESPQLSPDGKRVAMLVAAKEGRTVLAVADIATPQVRTGIARFDDGDVRSFHWVNDKRLIFDAIDLQAAMGKQHGAGLYAVDVDGSNFEFLVGRGRGFEDEGHTAIRPLRSTHVLHTLLRDGSDDIVVQRFNLRYKFEEPGTTLRRLNTRTRGTRELVNDVPDNAMTWVLDRAGVPRALVTIDLQGVGSVQWRKSDADGWVKVSKTDLNDPAPGSFWPEAIDADGRLIVTAHRGDEARTRALYRYDAEKRQLAAQPFLALKGYDFTGELIFDRQSRQLIGATYVSDAAGTEWLDPAMRALQERVDALLKTTSNQLDCEQACLTQARFVVTASSDRQSPIYFLFDKTRQGKDSLTLIGASRPWLDAARMAEQDMVRIKARDGMEFPVYVTKPRGKGPWPAVVLVHGGPYMRGVEWEWAADAQFLASRGYLVVEPEYRGSMGYGDRLFKAGWKQWGLKMQDDITDATKWAVDQGLADAKRLVIAGASYGGYATMMGLVKEPNLYRAGINWIGVTDIELMYSIDWSDFDDSVWQRYGMPKLVGDREKDKAQLDATSPLKRAAEITKPVLMAYGSKDLRVPLPHGIEMRDALKKAGKVEVEWVEYEDEGHGFMLEKNKLDFWTRVEKFLERHTR